VHPFRILTTRLAVLLATLAVVSAAIAPPANATATSAATGVVASTGSTSASPAPRHQVGYDHYSFTVDGHRVLVRSAEFHYFRLPSPSLWRDVLEKYRAAGFNAVSLYFDWAYHSPKPGVYDFHGVRDVDLLLRTAERAGLYVIARPGPYINAETTGGGFPGWLKNVPGRARSSAPGYTAAYRDWLHHIDSLIAPHQITRGGSVILYNAENEYATATDAAYMADVQATARADGIDVPITTNDCCDAASWTSTWASGPGAVQVPGVDDYPQSFDCAHPDTTWGPWGEGLTERLRDDIPVFAAEYQAGSIDEDGVGYAGCRELTGPAYMSYFDKSNLIVSGATAFNYYMGFGGTNWGWLGQPNDVYTSYDYGSAITENRLLTGKYTEFKRQNYFLGSVAPLAHTDPAAAPVPDDPAVQTVARADPETGTQFVLVRHSDRAATTAESATLDWQTPDGRYAVPVSLAGHDAQVLVAGYDMGGQRLVWSDSELMTHVAADGRDIALLYGTAGTHGSTVLRYTSAPSVRVLAGSVRSSYSAGDLRLDYTHSGLTRVLISGGGRRPLLLLLGTTEEAGKFWQAGTDTDPVLVRGTALVRSASVAGGTVTLRTDTDKAGGFEVFTGARQVVVNGVPVPVHATPSGSVAGVLPGPAPVHLPTLTGWRSRAEAPEAQPGFDDSGWAPADRTTTESPLKPKTPAVLYADDYGFHYGDVWYRGHFTATGDERTVSMNVFTGKRGSYLVWLNGHYLGSAAGGTQADSDAPVNPDPGHGDFTIPAGLLTPGSTAVLSVLVGNTGDNDDWTADDGRFKQPRGLYAVSVTGPTGSDGSHTASSEPAIAWRVQGTRGGEKLTDPVRGPLNNGGLYGERAGWHLPGLADGSWTEGVPARIMPGVTWQRTTFRLDLPKGQDVPIVLRFGAPPIDGGDVRIYLNGWNLGRYGSSVGPQTDFTLPAGLLRTRGDNTLALAVVARADVAPPDVSLVALADERGGVPVSDVPSPGRSR
jgi:beta-galactosidase GanA